MKTVLCCGKLLRGDVFPQKYLATAARYALRMRTSLAVTQAIGARGALTFTESKPQKTARG